MAETQTYLSFANEFYKGTRLQQLQKDKPKREETE